jgi:hypothetical protein
MRAAGPALWVAKGALARQRLTWCPERAQMAPPSDIGKEKDMDRRQFTKAMGAVVAGMTAGSRAFGDENKPADKKAAAKKVDKHVCKGRNECKGKGACHTEKNACAGQNECKGKGGCAAEAAKHSCAGKNECKGMGGCKSGDAGCAGKNSCKGKGGCEVPVKHLDGKKKDKSACSAKSGCKAA